MSAAAGGDQAGGGRQPSFKFQVHFFLLLPVAKLDHHPQLTRKERILAMEKGRFCHLTP
jgi:hypothetical protein